MKKGLNMKQKNNNFNLKIFRNVYSVVIGGGALMYTYYFIYFAPNFWITFIPWFLVLCFYIPIYYGLMLLLFKYDLENDGEWELEKGEAILLIGSGITLLICVLTFLNEAIIL